LAEALEDEGHPTLASQVRRGEIDHAAIATGAPLSAGLIARSEGVVVHSTWSLSRVRQLSAVPAFRIRHGIPVPAPIEPAAARRVLGLDPQTFLVVTLGEVTRAKRVDRLIAAVAQLPEA